MHFRQRVAWLLLAVYLLSSAGVLYYMFEINSHLRMFALDHVDKVHTLAASPLRPRAEHDENPIVEHVSFFSAWMTFLSSVVSHVIDISRPVLAVVVFIIYVQVCY